MMIRLGLRVNVTYTTDESSPAGAVHTKTMCVNFLDLSVPRKGNAVYMDGAKATVDLDPLPKA